LDSKKFTRHPYGSANAARMLSCCYSLFAFIRSTDEMQRRPGLDSSILQEAESPYAITANRGLLEDFKNLVATTAGEKLGYKGQHHIVDERQAPSAQKTDQRPGSFLCMRFLIEKSMDRGGLLGIKLTKSKIRQLAMVGYLALLHRLRDLTCARFSLSPKDGGSGRWSTKTLRKHKATSPTKSLRTIVNHRLTV
jgi:hypothetical protein